MEKALPSAGLLQFVPLSPLPRGMERPIGTPIATARWEPPSGARYSLDERALLVPRMHLESEAVRGLFGGRRALVDSLRGVEVELTLGDDDEAHSLGIWSYVWGDTTVFETGMPEVVSAVFLRGHIQYPELNDVMVYVRELTKGA